MSDDYRETSGDLTRHPRSGLLMRPDTLDEYVINEQRTYASLEIRPGDTVMDVGANIGAFCWLAAKAGPARVIGYEPDPDNFRVARLNTENLEMVTLKQAALVPDPEAGRVLLWRNLGKNVGMHSLVERRGREPVEVEALGILAEVQEYEPDVIKMDIEGGEYALSPFLLALPKHVRSLALELHLTNDHWRYMMAPELARSFLDQGFTCAREPKITAANWASMGCWNR